jgi:D-alanyl-D-alanine dipeptidase
MHDDFVYVDELLPDVRWDAKYATSDNFTGRPVDGYLVDRVVGSRALCAALDRAKRTASLEGCGLLLWDGYRPQRAVECFLRWSRAPEDGQTKPRHYPNIERADMVTCGYVAERSGHSRGSAVDLTLFDVATGSPVPMGGGHDLMDPVSHHGAAGITPAEARNRRRLRSIMESSGFTSLHCEWWHYSLADEPYPDTYFDFPVG